MSSEQKKKTVKRMAATTPEQVIAAIGRKQPKALALARELYGLIGVARKQGFNQTAIQWSNRKGHTEKDAYAAVNALTVLCCQNKDSHCFTGASIAEGIISIILPTVAGVHAPQDDRGLADVKDLEGLSKKIAKACWANFKASRDKGLRIGIYNFQDKAGGVALLRHVMNQLSISELEKAGKGQPAFDGDITASNGMLFITARRSPQEPDQTAFELRRNALSGKLEPVQAKYSHLFKHTMSDVIRTDSEASKKVSATKRLDLILANTVAAYCAEGDPEEDRRRKGLKVFTALVAIPENAAEACLDLVAAGIDVEAAQAINQAAKLIRKTISKLQSA